jgi:hypothetical protein
VSSPMIRSTTSSNLRPRQNVENSAPVDNDGADHGLANTPRTTGQPIHPRETIALLAQRRNAPDRSQHTFGVVLDPIDGRQKRR